MNERKTYSRNCPKCNEIIYYSLPSNFYRARTCNSKCKSCSQKRRTFSNETIVKMSISKMRSRNPKYWSGKSRDPESKRKMRISKLRRFESLGIGNREDLGAKEWFSKYNRETGSNFKSKTFWDIGYIADGYDSSSHSWIEYDTPYHRHPYIRSKDLIRQNNIIKYFESIGRPLNEFKRFITWNSRLETVYRNPSNE